MTDWSETQQKFRRLVLRRNGSVEQFAAQVPMSRRQAYRLMCGRVSRPSLAMRRAVERVCQAAQPTAPPTDE